MLRFQAALKQQQHGFDSPESKFNGDNAFTRQNLAFAFIHDTLSIFRHHVSQAVRGIRVQEE